MQRKTSILLGAGGAVALSLAAAAFAFAPEGHDPMAMFDKDGNGSISLAEIRQGAQAMFRKVDANNDGRISADEMRAHHRMMGPHHRGPDGAHREAPGGRLHMDADGDGAVTLAELQGQIEQHFAQADANRDGSISREEMEAAHRSMHAGR
jgi:5-hydroxyisourate hydrolase-like protein (transthyretin family)